MKWFHSSGHFRSCNWLHHMNIGPVFKPSLFSVGFRSKPEYWTFNDQTHIHDLNAKGAVCLEYIQCVITLERHEDLVSARSSFPGKCSVEFGSGGAYRWCRAGRVNGAHDISNDWCSLPWLLAQAGTRPPTDHLHYLHGTLSGSQAPSLPDTPHMHHHHPINLATFLGHWAGQNQIYMIRYTRHIAAPDNWIPMAIIIGTRKRRELRDPEVKFGIYRSELTSCWDPMGLKYPRLRNPALERLSACT